MVSDKPKRYLYRYVPIRDNELNSTEHIDIDTYFVLVRFNIISKKINRKVSFAEVSNKITNHGFNLHQCPLL